jgi:hypothetical protein
MTGQLMPYTIGGAVAGLVLSGTDFLMTKSLDCNTYTKYAIMGTGLGMLSFAILGRPNLFYLGGIPGFALGSIYAVGHEATFHKTMNGDYGQNAVEYMEHITAEEKHHHNMQEMRLMGYSGNQLLKKKKV